MRLALPVLLVTGLLIAAPAQAAKTYNDPWLEGDLEQLRVPEALDILARTPDPVTVGVVDSGARLTDPDLAPHLLKMSMPYTCASEYGPGPDYAADPANGDVGCDFIGSGAEDVPSTVPDGDPTDPFGHGTGAAAVIAAVANNGVEGAGVAPNARVLPVRACYGGNPDCYNEPALDGLTYAVAMGAKIISASWPPGNDYSSDFKAFIHDHSSVLFVFAIGGTDQNDDPYDLCTDDATYPNVICVGLVNSDDSAGTTNAEKSTDVSAPGYAGVPAADGSRSEFGYTSGATAHVSGAAAILRGLVPTLTPKQIRDVLVSTSRPHAGYATANMANGIVDVEAAVKAVQSMAGLTTPAPGSGAPADTPNPFTGSTPVATASSTATATPTETPAPTATPAPATATRHPTVKIGTHPRRVRAGHALPLRLTVRHGPVTVTVALRRGKRLVAKARKRGARGTITLKVKVPRKARRGVLKVTVTAGSAVAHTTVRVR